MPLLVTLRELAVVIVITAIPTLPFGVFAWWVLRRHRVRPDATTPFRAITVLTLLILAAVVLVMTAILLAVQFV